MTLSINVPDSWGPPRTRRGLESETLSRRLQVWGFEVCISFKSGSPRAGRRAETVTKPYCGSFVRPVVRSRSRRRCRRMVINPNKRGGCQLGSVVTHPRGSVENGIQDSCLSCPWSTETGVEWVGRGGPGRPVPKVPRHT